MAFPFGGHPTFGAYIEWARDKHGFQANSGFAASPSGKMVCVTRIFKPGGPSVVIVGTQQKDRLVPSEVGYIDRRLGLNSPWFSIDDGSAEPEDE